MNFSNVTRGLQNCEKIRTSRNHMNIQSKMKLKLAIVPNTLLTPNIAYFQRKVAHRSRLRDERKH